MAVVSVHECSMIQAGISSPVICPNLIELCRQAQRYRNVPSPQQTHDGLQPSCLGKEKACTVDVFPVLESGWFSRMGFHW